jgi:hypothetical protein
MALMLQPGGLLSYCSGGVDPVRAGLHRGPADTPPAPFGSRQRGSRRTGSARRPMRQGGAQEQQARRNITPVTSSSVREVLVESGSVPIPEQEIILTSNGSRQRKRMTQVAREEPQVKQVCAGIRKERIEKERREDLISILRFLDDKFAKKEWLSYNREFYIPILYKRKVLIV